MENWGSKLWPDTAYSIPAQTSCNHRIIYYHQYTLLLSPKWLNTEKFKPQPNGQLSSYPDKKQNDIYKRFDCIMIMTKVYRQWQRTNWYHSAIKLIKGSNVLVNEDVTVVIMSQIVQWDFSLFQFFYLITDLL